jgi:hypothetical protein
MDDHHVGDPFYAVPTTPQPMSSTAGQLPIPAPSQQPAEPEPVEDEPAVVPTATPDQPTQTFGVARSDLYGMRLSKLQEVARQLGLDDSGKRPALIARIRSHTNASPSS